MSESQNKRTVMVGLFVLIGVVFIIASVMMVGDMNETFKRKIQLVSLFDDVNGLQEGSNVWFSGVKIGTVSSLLFCEKSQVLVSFHIETSAKQYIRKNAKVKIGSDGLIGNKILVIYEGTTNVKEVLEGDTLMVAKTFSSDDMINMVQENNKNLLAITSDFKTISKNLAEGQGSIGKFLNDNTIYENISVATKSLQNTSSQAGELVNYLANFSAGLNKKGTFANQLITDTVVFNSVRSSVLQLQQIADTAAVLVTHLKEVGTDPNSPIGILTQDKQAGQELKTVLKNLESSSKKLDENLEALQHNFLLRGFFRKKAKNAAKSASAF